ncbi:rhodanese-like domain-containing protein [Arhodomonas sp. KWT2]|uniref:rhodanese-like domain-containing protein n=3 Tax=unclassified Arhodomonas TaxID=2621637 RepID=UPI0035C169DB
MDTLSPRELKVRLDARETLALLDVREPGEFGLRHPFWAVPLPYSRFELDLPRLVPDSGVPLVIADEGGTTARLAVRRARALGYRRVFGLEGGLRAWRRAGYGEFAGVHVPSKAFGELVEMRRHTPMIDAAELAARIGDGERFHLFDARPPAEYRRMSIPGARCCPNVELPVRLESLVTDPDTPIVINCAGRTRGIIGAQTLIELGVPNPVYALRNGTMGWELAGRTRAHGAEDIVATDAPATPSPGLRARIRALAADAGVSAVTAGDVTAWRAAGEPVYCLDVRQPGDPAAAPLPGTVRAPGVELIQATEAWIAVPTARVVLADDDGVRAPLCAYWLRLMGLDARVLPVAETALLPDAPVPAPLPALARCEAVAAVAEDAGGDGPPVLDLRGSAAHRHGHPPGARWLTRSRLGEFIPVLARERSGVRLLADDPDRAALVAGDLADHGIDGVALIDGGLDAWAAAGGPVVETPDDPPDRACIDRLFFVHDRHDGNLDAARRYLEWEQGLVPRLDAAERQAFARLGPAPGTGAHSGEDR